MKKKATKKLVLAKQTVAALLSQATGGATGKCDTGPILCVPSALSNCNCTQPNAAC